MNAAIKADDAVEFGSDFLSNLVDEADYTAGMLTPATLTKSKDLFSASSPFKEHYCYIIKNLVSHVL